MILINGKKDNYAVDTTRTIQFDWREYDFFQTSFEVSIFRDKERVFQHKEHTSNVVYYMNLDVSDEERKRFDVVVTINDGEHTLKNAFYSANQSLGKQNWITRLDNPIEKENVYYRERPGFLFERNFMVEDLNLDVFLDIAGLGYYDVHINGKKIKDYYLNSDVTNYSKVIYYDTYKVNDFISEGQNVIQVYLGNGWYNPAPLKLLGKYNMRYRMAIGKPMFLCQMTQFLTNTQPVKQILISDTDWGAKYTNLLFDNLYIGETRDNAHMLKELPNQTEKGIDLKTVRIGGPSGMLKPSYIDKIKRQKQIKPVEIKKLMDGYLIDFGLIISGQIKLKVNTIDQKLTLYYAEELINDSELDFSTTTTSTYGVVDDSRNIKDSDPVIQKDILYATEGENQFENQFTYHSFRYIKILAEETLDFEISEIVAFLAHTDVKTSSYFNSSEAALNRLYQASLHTKKNNLHSYYEDCARERLGYGGDIVALLESQILSFDSENLLIKVIQDFFNDQTTTGGITQTAPYMGIQTFGPSDRAGSLGWQMVISEIVLKFMKYYGNHILTADVIDGLQKHLKYLLSYDYDYIKHCCLGDWGSIDTVMINGKETPPDKEFCSAAMYVIMLNNYLLIGKEMKLSLEELDYLSKKVKEVKELICAEFKQPDNSFQNGSQSAYMFALKAQLVDNEPEYIQQFIHKLKEDHFIFKCGIFGMSWTYQFLEDYPEIIYSWLNRTEHPSFLKMIDENAQTLSEYFEKMPGSSLNHAMFSSYESWFITDLLGLKFNSQFSKTGKLEFKPFIPDNISFIEGSFTSIYGKIDVSWKRVEGSIIINLTVPQAINLTIDGQLDQIEHIQTGNCIQYQLVTGY